MYVTDCPSTSSHNVKLPPVSDSAARHTSTEWFDSTFVHAIPSTCTRTEDESLPKFAPRTVRRPPEVANTLVFDTIGGKYMKLP